MCNYCSRAGRWLANCQRRATPSPPQEPVYSLQPRNSQDVVSQQPSTSTSTMAYPGSNFASDGEVIRENSRDSASSNISVCSMQSIVQIIRGSYSIEELARSISRDLGELKGTKDDLEAWAASIDPLRYRKRKPWTRAMERARDRYTQLSEAYGRDHQTFLKHFRATKNDTTPEHHVECARLAIAWGEATVRAADARLEFMTTYRDAYELEGINGHIQRAQQAINSGRTAVKDARKSYDDIWAVAGRSTDPSMFR